MAAIVESIGTMLNALLNLGDMGLWVFTGILRLASTMDDAISVLTSVLKIFPFEVYTAIVAVFGGLVVLRIFGRS